MPQCKKLLRQFAIAAFLLLAGRVTGRAEIPPVYVTVAGHIEDNAYYANCPQYTGYRAGLLIFADLMAARGIPWNLQSDYEFFYGTLNCETPAMQAQTGGTNIIHFLATQRGVEIDAHQEGGVEEGSPDNYADVRWLGGVLTTSISENVGGFLWDNPPQFARLAGGERGQIHSHFVWFPEVLTLAVSSNHHYVPDFSMDDVASGVWRPKGVNANFWEHEPAERMIYIGPGECNWGGQEYRLSASEYVMHLVEALQSGDLPATNMYTATMTVPQSMIFNTNRHAELTAMLDALEPYVASGQVEYVTYSQAAQIWLSDFAGRPSLHIRGANPSEIETDPSEMDRLRLRWMGLYDRRYAIERATNGPSGAWSPVPGFESITGKNEVIAIPHDFVDDNAMRVYRLRMSDGPL